MEKTTSGRFLVTHIFVFDTGPLSGDAHVLARTSKCHHVHQIDVLSVDSSHVSQMDHFRETAAGDRNLVRLNLTGVLRGDPAQSACQREAAGPVK